MRTQSSLAVMTQQPQDVRNRPDVKAFGVMVHTAGRGVLDKAKEWGVSPLKAAERIYTRKGASFAHYVIGHDGTILQIADEIEMAWHSGMPNEQRVLYTSGAWTGKVPPTALARWKAKWAGRKAPTDLYPTSSPNACYIGIELVPESTATFTPQQYDKCGALICDIATRHGFMKTFIDATFPSPRLVGHEDIEPLERWDKNGGWDPGALREVPKFDWNKIYKRIRASFVA